MSDLQKAADQFLTRISTTGIISTINIVTLPCYGKGEYFSASCFLEFGAGEYFVSSQDVDHLTPEGQVSAGAITCMLATYSILSTRIIHHNMFIFNNWCVQQHKTEPIVYQYTDYRSD